MYKLQCVFPALLTATAIFYIGKVSGTTNGTNESDALLNNITNTRKLLGGFMQKVDIFKTDLFRKIKTIDIENEIKAIRAVKQMHGELLNASSNVTNVTIQYQLDHCHTLFDYGMFRLDAQLRDGLLRLALLHALTPLDSWVIINHKLLDEIKENYGGVSRKELLKCETDQQSKKTPFCEGYLYNMYTLNSLNNYMSRQDLNVDSVLDRVRPFFFDKDWSESVNEILGDQLHKCIHEFPTKKGIFAFYPPPWKLNHCDNA